MLPASNIWYANAISFTLNSAHWIERENLNLPKIEFESSFEEASVRDSEGSSEESSVGEFEGSSEEKSIGEFES